jgi:hypothetical protein
VRAAAETMRDNPKLDEAAAITELGVGEALVSLLDDQGRPNVVERAFIVPPQAQVGPITVQERQAIISSSLLAGHYENVVDRESAYEILKGRAGRPQQTTAGASPSPGGSGLGGLLGGIMGGGTGRRQSMGEALVKSAVRTIGSEVGRQIVRGVLGSLLGGGRRR